MLLAWLHVPSLTEIGARSSSRTTRSRRSREVCATKLSAGRCTGYSVPSTKLMALKQEAKSPRTEETGTAQKAVRGRLLKGLGPDRKELPVECCGVGCIYTVWSLDFLKSCKQGLQPLTSIYSFDRTNLS